MPIYNVRMTFETTMVVVADDENHALEVAKENTQRAIDDTSDRPKFDVRGEVTMEGHLRDEWDGWCVPYGGDGNTRLRKLLAKAE